MPLDATWCRLMNLDATCFSHVKVTSLLVLRFGGCMGVDTEINAKPAQAEAGVGAGAELGNMKIMKNVKVKKTSWG